MFSFFLHPQRQPTFPKCSMGLECLLLHVTCLYIYRKVKQNVGKYSTGIRCIWIRCSICMPPGIFVSSDGRTEKKTPIEHIHYIYCNHPFGIPICNHNKAPANQYSLSNTNSCLNDPKTSRWAPTNYKRD